MNDVLFEKKGLVGLVTLNRVSALNALTHDMICALAKQLELWRDDDGVACVVLVSTSEKAFSAGGDIRELYDSRGNPPYHFFWDEYRLNQVIHRYPKPYISLINGIVMGGGVGISLNGRYVVAGENITFAMPEVGIGFFPDVGGTYMLPRMKGRSGTYCAMTGGRLKQGDVHALGLATHAIQSEHFSAIIEELADGGNVDDVLGTYHQDVAPRLSDSDLTVIDACFSKETVSRIIEALDASDDPFAANALEQLRAKSPTSVHVALGQMVRGAERSFEECMQLEYRIVHRILEEDDFYEGVRATIIDKDGAPNWNPADLDSVQLDRVEAHFAPLDGPELKFE